MKQEVLKFFPQTWMIVLGLFLFLGSFSGIVWRTFFQNKKEFYEEISQIPLRSNEK